MAASKKKDDPTVTSEATAEFPDGAHPARPLSEVTGSAENRKYADNPDKPDPTTVAQVEVSE